MTSCFVRRDRVQTRDARGGVGAGGGHACAVEARRRGVAVAGCAVDAGRGARFNGWRIDSNGELIFILLFMTKIIKIKTPIKNEMRIETLPVEIINNMPKSIERFNKSFF